MDRRLAFDITSGPPRALDFAVESLDPTNVVHRHVNKRDRCLTPIVGAVAQP